MDEPNVIPFAELVESHLWSDRELPGSLETR